MLDSRLLPGYSVELNLAVTTGIQYFAVCPNLCRVQNFGHTATSPFAVSQKKNTRQTKGARQKTKKRTAKKNARQTNKNSTRQRRYARQTLQPAHGKENRTAKALPCTRLCHAFHVAARQRLLCRALCLCRVPYSIFFISFLFYLFQNLY